LKIILLDHQNNFVGILLKIMSKTPKSFDILATDLNVLHDYFDDPTKLLSGLYLATFLDTSAKPFFSCAYTKVYSSRSISQLTMMFKNFPLPHGKYYSLITERIMERMILLKDLKFFS